MKKICRPLVLIALPLFVFCSSPAFARLSAVVAPSMIASRSLESVERMERTGSPIIATSLATPKLDFQSGANLLSMETLMTMTPETYRQMTGKRLGLFKSVQLKWVQKQMKKQQADNEGGGLPKWAYIVMSIFALGWLAIGIRSDFKGNDWWIALLLYFVFYFPGLIYSLIVMKKYY